MTLFTIILEMAVAFVAVFFIAVTLEAPKRTLRYGALAGALGWGVYLVGLLFLDIVAATFLASLFIAWIAHLFARLLKTPVTIYFIPAFITLVPGAGVYQSVYSFINKEYAVAQQHLVLTLQISGAIALAIFIVDSLFGLMARIKASREKNSPAK
ncbi:threonine/serine exporter family protein [uncultured Trichococcus sp.]|uniref:threonine/serine exporter family protein n=1 Tax=uncultured Trichococcus sp. TaxID=189665 RepID=UPI002A18CFCB|nr:threonine/serine exporter family protein [uncultured Trichococcus sp.]